MKARRFVGQISANDPTISDQVIIRVLRHPSGRLTSAFPQESFPIEQTSLTK